MLITVFLMQNYKTPKTTTSGSTAPFEPRRPPPRILAGSTMTPVCARIGKMPATACLEIVAYTHTTGQITRLGGRWRKTSRGRRESGGGASTTPTWPMRSPTTSRIYRSSRCRRSASIAQIHSRTLLKFLAGTSSA